MFISFHYQLFVHIITYILNIILRGDDNLSSYIRIIYDRLDFIEFKQNLILLKQPQHKASVFFNLTLDDFLKIRDFTFEFESSIKSGVRYSISDYENKLFEIWPLIKSYPSSSTLVAKILMSEDVFNSLFASIN